jgi:hypothetical protein
MGDLVLEERQNSHIWPVKGVLEVLIDFVIFTVHSTPEGGDGVVWGSRTVSWWGGGGSREDGVEPSSHSLRMRWSAGNRIKSEVFHTVASWESVEDLALKRKEVFVNKMVEVLLKGPELSGQAY